MNTSLLKELRFTIGEQYELNEFNLKSIESTFSHGLEFDSYEYVKDDFKALFGLEFSNNIILQYNGDILYSVIYEFVLNHHKHLCSEISECSFKDIVLEVLLKDECHCQLIIRKK